MKQKMKQKKGISPLIAAVLLIAFTVAIATLIAGWFSTFTRSTTSAVTNKTNLAVDCSSESISIKEVYVKTNSTNPATVRALVENNGFTDNLNITSAFVFNSSGQSTISSNIPVTGFNRGNIVAITFNAVGGVAIPTCPTNFDRVVVATDCGGVSDTFTGTPKCE